MAHFVLVHGAGSSSWYWHLVVPELEACGDSAVAVDLPCDDDDAGLTEYADAIVDAIGVQQDVIVVAQSLAGFSAPLACDRAPVELLVLLNAMVPTPGETAGSWWANTGQPQAMLEEASRHGKDGASAGHLMEDVEYLFLHDVPSDIAAGSARGVRKQSDTPFREPWPSEAWPDVATVALIGGADRLFPASFQRRVLNDRLRLVPDDIESGHLTALSRPEELAARLEGYTRELLS